MKPPIIVNNFGDVVFFASVADAEGWLEAIDVENNEYVAYDSEGRLVTLGVVTKQKGFFSGGKRVVVERAEAEPTHALELRNTLVHFFGRVGASKDWLASAALEELVKRGIEHHQTK